MIPHHLDWNSIRRGSPHSQYREEELLQRAITLSRTYVHVSFVLCHANIEIPILMYLIFGEHDIPLRKSQQNI